MNQDFCFPGFSDDLLDVAIFVECKEFLDKFNFNPILLCDLFRIQIDLFCKGLGKTGIIKIRIPLGFIYVVIALA